MISDPDLFWSLMGPRRFLDRLVGAIDGRVSFVVEAPDHGVPGELALAVGERKRHEWRCRAVDLATLPADAFIDEHEGVRTMIRALGLDPPDGEIALGPLAEAGLRGWTLWFDGRDCDDPHLISGLVATLAEVMAALKNRPSQRPTLVVELRAAQITDLRVPGAVARFTWQGVLDRLDTAVYVRERAEATLSMPDPLREAVAVELIGYDLNLADEVLGAWTGDVEAMEEVLEPVRDGRGWERDPSIPDLVVDGDVLHESLVRPWRAGWLDVWPRRRVHLHPAVLPTRGLMSIEQRVLSAQARVLFPEIETQRATLAHWAERNGIVPATQGLDLATAQVSELVPEVRRFCRLRFPDEADWAQRLLAARNKLAHRKLLTIDEGQDLLGG